MMPVQSLVDSSLKVSSEGRSQGSTEMEDGESFVELGFAGEGRTSARGRRENTRSASTSFSEDASL